MVSILKNWVRIDPAILIWYEIEIASSLKELNIVSTFQFSTALYLAVEEEHMEIIYYILKQEPDVNAKGPNNL